MENNLLSSIIDEFLDFLSPCLFLKDEKEVAQLFNAIGWDEKSLGSNSMQKIMQNWSQIGTNIKNIEQVVLNNNNIDIGIITSDFKNIFSITKDIPNALYNSDISPDKIKEFSSDFISYLLFQYLNSNQKTLYNVLTLLRVIKDYPLTISSVNNKDGYGKVYPIFKFENLINFTKNPLNYLKQEYLVEGLPNDEMVSAFTSQLYPYLVDFCNYLNIPALYGSSIEEFNDDLLGQNLNNSLMFYKRILVNNQLVLTGVTFGVFGTNQDGPGIFIKPFGNLDFSKNYNDWDFAFKVNALLDGLVINKNKIVFFNGTESNNTLSASISGKKLKKGDDPVLIIGDKNAISLTISNVEIEVYSKIKKDLEFGVIVILYNIKFNSKEGPDNFLKELLPDNLYQEFDIRLAIDNKNGFHFSGSGGLDLNIPTHQKIGPIDLSEINLGIQPSDKGIAIKAAANIGATLGPLKINVKDLGLQARTNFPSDASGNLGLIDLGIGIKPPTGIGIAIDASAIKGAGFLAFNPEKGEYSGVFYLNVLNQFTVKIIGLLNTKRPDGRDGFSLLFIITAEFPAPGFQLGFGFALMGIGGLLGINRGISEKQLLESVSNKSLEALLFPESKSEETFLAQMPAIVQNIAGIFPVTEGGYLFGALAKITWGTPTILTVDLGIVLEFLTGGGGEKVNEGDATGFNIYMMGVLHCSLPDPSAPIIQLKAVFAGALSFQKKELWFFMAIEDSRILSFTISGEMLLQISWGSQPDFLLTMGGFFPGFRAANLKKQDIKRLAISFLDTDFARISAEYYFALTPNTVQFGAKLQARFALDPLEVTGVLEFDTLIQFNPFHFVVHFGADFEVKVYGHTLFGVGVQANVEGPNPFHVWGTVYVKFKIIFTIKISKDFDVTFGDSASEAIPPDINVWEDLLKPAIEAKESWAALPQLNYSISEKVSVSNEEEGLLILHPFGRLQMHQNAVPLGINIQKVGSRKATNEETFTIKSVFEQSVETLKLEQSKQLFAPSQFKKYSDEDKLSLPAFEEFNNGFILPDSEIYFPDKDKYHSRDLRYENIYIKRDTKKRTPSDIMGLLSQWSAQKRGVTGFLESAKTVGHYTKANGVWTKNDKSYSTYAEALDALTNPENGQKTTTRRKKQEYFIIDDHYIIK